MITKITTADDRNSVVVAIWTTTGYVGTLRFDDHTECLDFLRLLQGEDEGSGGETVLVTCPNCGKNLTGNLEGRWNDLYPANRFKIDCDECNALIGVEVAVNNKCCSQSECSDRFAVTEALKKDTRARLGTSLSLPPSLSYTRTCSFFAL